ncbi:hypothetical protein QQX98_010225 [Neonectria punicea]|uniref:Uncharacterized protein n=1 Tax=Neonectria punicea TaxID=979145 RepID=A0ABR1GQJ7_9HYPO
MSSSTVTSILLPQFEFTSLKAAVLDADATATTYLLNCPWDDPDYEYSDSCGTYNNTVTVGPWASKTLSLGAAKTGVWDLYINMPSISPPWTFSVHCEMSRTVAQECTKINIGGNNDGTPTVTVTSPDGLEDLELDAFSYIPITITAGQELLAATHSASDKATTTDDTSDSAQSTASKDADSKALSSE